MGSLDYCSHGRRLVKPPSEDCEKCQKLYDTMNALDYAKALVRALDKQMQELTQSCEPRKDGV